MMTAPQRHKIMVAAALVAAVAGIAYLGLCDPTLTPLLRCPFRALTGYDCPGCGSQRAIHALLHGELAQAWSYNPFIFIAIPLAALYAVAEYSTHRFRRLRAALLHPWCIIAVAVVVTAYWVMRNI